MPQILKEAVKDKILQSALDCFLRKGYRHTSMREIAQSAGSAAGNIYNYFSNKEELLSTLINPVLVEIKALFGVRAQDLPLMTAQDKMGLSQQKMAAFIKVYVSHKKVFVLLFEKCDSTKFETTKADVIESLGAAIIYAKESFTPNPVTPEQEILIKAFAAALINGMITVLAQNADEDVKLRAMQKFLPFIRSNMVDALS